MNTDPTTPELNPDSLPHHSTEGTASIENPPPEERLKQNKTLKRMFRVLWGIIFLLTLLLIIRLWVLTPYRIPTSSMDPTLRGDNSSSGIIGDTVLVNKTAYWFKSPKRWDIVAFHSPQPEEGGPINLVKRIVGLPGETVYISGDQVHIDGKKVIPPPEASYLRYRQRGTYGVQDVRLGENEYYVLGDNSPYSQDSRYWGPLSKDKIFGQVIAILGPKERRTWLEYSVSEPIEH